MATATAEKAKPAKKKSILSGVTKKKVVRVRRAHLADEKYTGGEPQWDTERAEKMDDKEFDHYLAKSLYYYNYHFSVKDLKPELIKWDDKPLPGGPAVTFQGPAGNLARPACITMPRSAGLF